MIISDDSRPLSSDDLIALLEGGSDIDVSDDDDPEWNECFHGFDPHDDELETESSSDQPSTSSATKVTNRPAPKAITRRMKWKKRNFDDKVEDLPDNEWSVGSRELWTPLRYFEQYFSDDMWSLVAEQTNIRALQENQRPLQTNSKEIKQLVGAHIITGCMKLPRLRMYYRRGLRVPTVTVIPRDRMFKLRNYLHFVDNLRVSNEEKEINKLWKVQPILDAVRRKCLSLPLTRHLSVDEQMIPFTGNTSLLQFVKGKPNPVGLKNFVLATPGGLVLDFFIYQGAKTWPDGKPCENLGVGGSVVAKLVEGRIPSEHTVYCDRYFTSVPLLDYLLERRIFATGTILTSRVETSLRTKLTSDADLKKRGRGSFDEFVREDGKISILKWMDNRSVLLASTGSGATPTHHVRRWDKKNKTYVDVEQPKTIHNYNMSMGGVDLSDRMISFYRISTRTKKWPVRVLFHFIDLAIVNSWLEYRLDQKALGHRRNQIMDLLDFKIYIGESLSSATTTNRRDIYPSDSNSDIEDVTPQPAKKRRSSIPVPNVDIRKSGNNHLPICAVSDKNKWMRCRNKSCKGKTKFQCSQCKIFLCISSERQCFFEFHR